MSTRRIRYSVLAAVAAAVGAYYLWQARAANGPFEWRSDLNGYYDLLARGFLGGHLYVPIQPSPQLLALPDPWDPKVDDSLRWQDMALYRGHYYLYFGAAPALLLFAPWRLVTGHDLPENFAICLLCFGGFLLSCGALLRILDLAQASPGPILVAFLFLALGLCPSTPFLLNRVAVYEIAIASGYFFVAAGVFFLTRGIGPDGSVTAMAASGAMFGLALASRPHLALAGLIVLAGVFLAQRLSRGFVVFAAAWAILGLGVAVYNFERFGSPLEFGFRYQLAGPGQNRVEVAARNLVPGMYYMLLSRPELSGVFPWIRMVFRFPFDSAVLNPLPPEYFVEPTVGALWTAPFLLTLLLVRTRHTKHPKETALLIGIPAACGAAVLLFLMSTHLATHRYEVDFVAFLVFAAVAAIGISGRRGLTAVACVVIGYSVLANLALALAGPYDDFLRSHPARYVRLARRFSPAAEFRPMAGPRIAVRMMAQFTPAPAGFHEPLVTIGHSHYCYFLYAERGPGAIRLISRTNDSHLEYDAPDPGAAPLPIGLVYAPESGEMAISISGREVLRHRIGLLVTAPAQVAIGENYADFGLTARRFTGQWQLLEKTVAEAPR